MIFALHIKSPFKAVLPSWTFCNNRNIYVCDVQYGSHQPHVTIENLKSG